jgi:hypothetical protein
LELEPDEPQPANARRTKPENIVAKRFIVLSPMEVMSKLYALRPAVSVEMFRNIVRICNHGALHYLTNCIHL